MEKVLIKNRYFFIGLKAIAAEVWGETDLYLVFTDYQKTPTTTKHDRVPRKEIWRYITEKENQNIM